VLRSFGTVSDINQETSLTITQYSRDAPTLQAGAETEQQTGGFYVGIDLESYSNTSMDSVYTGTNTSTDDIFWVGRFNNQNNVGNVRVDAWALYDQLILIENGVCRVNY
jgi:hypothetical protein